MSDDSFVHEIDPVKLKAHITKINQENKIMAAKNSDLIKGNTKIKSDFDKISATKIEMEAKIKVIQDQNVKMTSNVEQLEAKLKASDDKVILLEKRLENTPRSIAVDNIPTYFKKVVESFNTNLKTDENSNVDFVIGAMDVELKTHLMADKDDKLIISTPNVENLELKKDTLSTIKFSIKPIPKERIED